MRFLVCVLWVFEVSRAVAQSPSTTAILGESDGILSDLSVTLSALINNEKAAGEKTAAWCSSQRDFLTAKRTQHVTLIDELAATIIAKTAEVSRLKSEIRSVEASLADAQTSYDSAVSVRRTERQQYEGDLKSATSTIAALTLAIGHVENRTIIEGGDIPSASAGVSLGQVGRETSPKQLQVYVQAAISLLDQLRAVSSSVVDKEPQHHLRPVSFLQLALKGKAGRHPAHHRFKDRRVSVTIHSKLPQLLTAVSRIVSEISRPRAPQELPSLPFVSRLTGQCEMLEAFLQELVMQLPLFELGQEEQYVRGMGRTHHLTERQHFGLTFFQREQLDRIKQVSRALPTAIQRLHQLQQLSTFPVPPPSLHHFADQLLSQVRLTLIDLGMTLSRLLLKADAHLYALERQLVYMPHTHAPSIFHTTKTHKLSNRKTAKAAPVVVHSKLNLDNVPSSTAAKSSEALDVILHGLKESGELLLQDKLLEADASDVKRTIRQLQKARSALARGVAGSRCIADVRKTISRAAALFLSLARDGADGQTDDTDPKLILRLFNLIALSAELERAATHHRPVHMDGPASSLTSLIKSLHANIHALKHHMQVAVDTSVHPLAIRQVRHFRHRQKSARRGVILLEVTSGRRGESRAAEGPDYLDASPTFNSAYTPQSDQILGVLKNLKDNFVSGLAELNATETRRQTDFETLIESKRDEVALMRTDLQRKRHYLAEAQTLLHVASAQRNTLKEGTSAEESATVTLVTSCQALQQESNKKLKATEDTLLAVDMTLKKVQGLLESSEEAAVMTTPSPSMQAAIAAATEVALSANRPAQPAANKTQLPQLNATTPQPTFSSPSFQLHGQAATVAVPASEISTRAAETEASARPPGNVRGATAQVVLESAGGDGQGSKRPSMLAKGQQERYDAYPEAPFPYRQYGPQYPPPWSYQQMPQAYMGPYPSPNHRSPSTALLLPSNRPSLPTRGAVTPEDQSKASGLPPAQADQQPPSHHTQGDPVSKESFAAESEARSTHWRPPQDDQQQEEGQVQAILQSVGLPLTPPTETQATQQMEPSVDPVPPTSSKRINKWRAMLMEQPTSSSDGKVFHGLSDPFAETSPSYGGPASMQQRPSSSQLQATAVSDMLSGISLIQGNVSDAASMLKGLEKTLTDKLHHHANSTAATNASAANSTIMTAHHQSDTSRTQESQLTSRTGANLTESAAAAETLDGTSDNQTNKCMADKPGGHDGIPRGKSQGVFSGISEKINEEMDALSGDCSTVITVTQTAKTNVDRMVNEAKALAAAKPRDAEAAQLLVLADTLDNKTSALVSLHTKSMLANGRCATVMHLDTLKAQVAAAKTKWEKAAFGTQDALAAKTRELDSAQRNATEAAGAFAFSLQVLAHAQSRCEQVGIELRARVERRLTELLTVRTAVALIEGRAPHIPLQQRQQGGA
ncbi:unnamed protein product [Vitrella brassicaformis CCMP3155]|uniref:I/LWEQ domain-containing protein n=1 Tax=Vitrella brassicaformis (strain CCMP3155) TaxID=1169540 RepID=A0A0G4G9D3_VITBC|nr:unnamed protein product [Vitrella brassicaformis CCMP3155]|eukprot:CEM25403.1 unnamed protein product [Vitrella brassicaformis CCMP3155]